MEPPAKKIKNHSCKNTSETEGAAAQNSYHGMFYHTFLAMKIMLGAFLEHCDHKLPSFDLTMEDRERGGKFDDIVCGYELPTRETGTICIQAKHKEQTIITPSNRKSFPTLQGLCSEKGNFSIPIYFTYYLEQYQKRTDKSLHTFMLCTNAPLVEEAKNSLGLKDQSTNDRMPPIISSFCNIIQGQCYAFTNDQSKTSQQNEIETLLREATIKELAKTLLRKPSTEEQKNLKQSIVKAYAYLIARCVKKDASGKLRFNEMFLKPKDTSKAMGKLYKAVNPKQSNELELCLDNIDPISSDLQIDETLCYATVDEAMKHFFQEFLLVTGTMNEAELDKTAHEPMPSWVGNSHLMSIFLYPTFNKGLRGNTIHMKELQDLFIAAKPNENYNRILHSTKTYTQNLSKKYPDIEFEPDRIENSKLFKFVTNKSPVDEADFFHRYHSQSNRQISSLIVQQTLGLTPYLFAISSSSGCKELCPLTADVVEFIADVGLSDNIIVIFGELNDESLKQKVLKKRLKVIVIEEIADKSKVNHCEHESNERVGDLTKKSKDLQLSKNWQCFGIPVALNRIVKDDDSLNFLCNVLNHNKGENEENVNKQKFKEISSWYVPRSTEPYKNNASELCKERFILTFPEELDVIPFDSLGFKCADSAELVKHVLTENSDANTSDDTPFFTNQSKVSIIVDDAGHGKSTFCTHLAARLSEDPSLCVVRINALTHATQFVELQKKYSKPLDETNTVRIIYYLLQLNPFVTNINNQSDENNDMKRKRAIQMAEIITVTNGKVVLDDQQAVYLNFTPAELLSIRSFQDIFNSFIQFDLVFDGFDEIAPFSKTFVMKFLAKLSTLDGIRKLYISSRPYNFVDELRKSFNDCKIYQLKPFTTKDVLCFLKNFLHKKLPAYSQCSTDPQMIVLAIVHNLFRDDMNALIRIPLLLHMGCTILYDKIKENINCTSRTVIKGIFDQDHIDEFYIISEFVEQKITILNMEKRGITKDHLHNPAMKQLILRDNTQLKEEHALLALFAMFNENDRDKLLKDPVKRQKASRLLQDVAEGSEKTGIVLGVVDNVPQFSHRIFAEYFAACFLFAEKQRMKNEPFFRSESYWRYDLKRVRLFFDRIIVQESTDCELHMAVLIDWEEQIRNVSNNSGALTKKDPVGRLPLHLAINTSLYGTWLSFAIDGKEGRNAVELIISKMSAEQIETQDELFQWTALHYAFVTRREIWVDILLNLNAKVDADILLSQLLSNNLKYLLINADVYGLSLAAHEHTKKIADQLQISVVENLLKRPKFNIFTPQNELNALSVMEFCAQKNMAGIFKLFLSKTNVKASPEMSAKFYKLAFEHKAYDIVYFLIDDCNIPLSENIEIAQLIAFIKLTIKNNHISTFEIIFQLICTKLHVQIDTEKYCKIYRDVSTHNGHDTPIIDSNIFRGRCCKESKFTPPEEEDCLYKEYVIQDLLAFAVIEGNKNGLDYVFKVTETIITNELTMKIMERLKRYYRSCHKKSIPVFLYLLENSPDWDREDEQGRNLLHLTIENGCSFMLPCLIAKGLEPDKKDKKYMSAFDYADSCHLSTLAEDKNRSEAIKKYFESIKP